MPLVFTLFVCATLPQQAPALSKTEADHVRAELERVVEKYKLPGIGAAVVCSKGVRLVQTAGVRKLGSQARITAHDQFHLGSDTKAMTAMLLALLVQKKLLRWEQTLGETFPELAEKMDPAYRKVTVEQLMHHRAGLPANLPGGWWKISRKLPIRSQREEVLALVLSQKPEHSPGSEFLYSNLGYTIAGHVAERVGKEPWEKLMHKYIFDPLKMKSAGFGAPGHPEKLDQPWGHHPSGKPVEPGPTADNPPVMGPAGRAHMSLGDWGKFIADQLKGARGEHGLLPPQAYRKLHEPPAGAGNYAGGWGRQKVPTGWRLAHDGSNTMNYCTAALFPVEDIAVLVATNMGGKEATKATHEVLQAILKMLRHKD